MNQLITDLNKALADTLVIINAMGPKHLLNDKDFKKQRNLEVVAQNISKLVKKLEVANAQV